LNEVFDRVNRNQRKLERQELRHAKYSGWLITYAEKEADEEDWKLFGVSSNANARRMRDIQFISELMLVILDREIIGFDQDILDAKFAEYDDPLDTKSNFNEEDFATSLLQAKASINVLETTNNVVSLFAKSFINFYTLWAYIVLNEVKPEAAVSLAQKYIDFMTELSKALKDEASVSDPNVLKYLSGARGATTDIKQRRARLEALTSAFATE
jgi:hypothetical protein